MRNKCAGSSRPAALCEPIVGLARFLASRAGRPPKHTNVGASWPAGPPVSRLAGPPLSGSARRASRRNCARSRRRLRPAEAPPCAMAAPAEHPAGRSAARRLGSRERRDKISINTFARRRAAGPSSWSAPLRHAGRSIFIALPSGAAERPAPLWPPPPPLKLVPNSKSGRDIH